VRLVSETAAQRDLGQRLVGHYHHLLSTFYSPSRDVIAKCLAETDLEGTGEMACAEA
jgi:hypothetical protein